MTVGSVTADHPVISEVATGPAASYAGLRQAISDMRSSGATFGSLPTDYAAEWATLFPGEVTPALPLRDIALAASERRLHRESEQVYRTIAVAAAALCAGMIELDRPLVLRGLNQTDLSSLRGFMRAFEFARMDPSARIVIDDIGAVRVPKGVEADFRADRRRCLARMDASVAESGWMIDSSPAVPTSGVGQEAGLFEAAIGDQNQLVDRLAAALSYCQAGFFSANWEGMAIVALESLHLLPDLSEARVTQILDQAIRSGDDREAAIEFEPGILRTATDLGAYFAKVLGIQATFRGDQTSALNWFRRMREAEEGLSPEVRAQSHLYSALTLTKRKRELPAAVGELEAGFAALAPIRGEPASMRRERGWLHNLRGLTFFAEKRHKSAFEQEKQALECLADLDDASSTHLRINIYSNISVLQERSGKPEMALRTWERFAGVAGADSISFRKHHSYRSAGLKLLVGQSDVAVAELGTVLEAARAGTDDFHECEVNLELGGLHLRLSNTDAAESHFVRAEAAARRIGDPYRTAQAMAGRNTAGDSTVSTKTAIDIARRSLTHPRAAAELAAELSNGCVAIDSLPQPRTKLNRPFDLVNFQDCG
ncbi:tetratricopeptide repeat protein [Rhodococcus sp. 5A-K4]|uniref:tetratricopeptide repeat protein n=1 Tax=Rhodococcus TaxID=1827 RepID=UPI00355C634C